MRTLIIFTAVAILFIGCKKNQQPPPSPTPQIKSFVLKKSANANLSADIAGIITSDSIKLLMPAAIDLSNLVADVSYTGSSLSPGTHTAQNFSSPVTYTVTAADGKQRKYTVTARHSSTTKEITSFILKAADNRSLSTDITGIINGDVIELQIPAGASSLSFVPSITHTGTSVSPANQQSQDFSAAVSYSVQAEDGSVKLYKVKAGMNATVYIGSEDGFVYALNANTGELKWKYETGAGILSNPTVDNGTVYIGSKDHYFYALDAATGALKWKTWMNGNAIGPVVHNGILYVALDDIIALEAATGTILWRTKPGYLQSAPPTVSNGKLFYSSWSFGYICSNATNGNDIWQYNAGIARSNPAVLNGILYAGGEGAKLIAVDVETGIHKWTSQEPGFGSPGSPTVYKGAVYIGAYDAKLYAFDSTTGATKWSFDPYPGQYGTAGVFMSVVGSQDMLFSARSDGYLYALDAATGTLKWKMGERRYDATDFFSLPNVTIANGIVYCGSHDKYIYALDAMTGSVRWKYLTNGAVYSGPCVIDLKGEAYHAGNSGNQQ